MFYAHSPDAKKGIAGQSYAAHIAGVVAKANQAAVATAKYASSDGLLLQLVVAQAAEFHDLGKLDSANQEILSGTKKALSLPIQHTDAGTAHFLDLSNQSPLSAAIIRSHHIGLPDFIEESNREEKFLRDNTVAGHVNKTLESLRELHRSICNESQYKIRGCSR